MTKDEMNKKLLQQANSLTSTVDSLNARECPKVCVNLQTGVRYNYSVWRFLLWQEEKVTHHRKQQCAK